MSGVPESKMNNARNAKNIPQSCLSAPSWDVLVYFSFFPSGYPGSFRLLLNSPYGFPGFIFPFRYFTVK